MSPRRRTRLLDPDVRALTEAGGGLYDARTLVVNQARKLNARYREWDDGGSTPFQRIKQLASLAGFSISPMALDGSHDTRREAVVILADSSKGKRGGQIFYNPLRSQGRILFSIAHEIAHSFFPSTVGGARFRELLEDDLHDISELERLCHVGAAELLMPAEDFQSIVGTSWSLNNAKSAATFFGASIEATVFRFATACPHIAAAGMARHRRTKSDENKLAAINFEMQSHLFEGDLGDQILSIALPKYRRQSFHISENYPEALFIPWNKSFDESSCIYRTEADGVVSATEKLPAQSCALGTLEAIEAPYQRPEADPDHPDILFFWKVA